MNRTIISGICITAAVALCVFIYANFASNDQETATALQRCVDQKIKAVPAPSKPAGAIALIDICKETLRIN